MRLAAVIVTALGLQLSLSATGQVSTSRSVSATTTQLNKSAQTHKLAIGKYALTDIGVGTVAGINAAGQVAYNLPTGEDGGHAGGV